MKYDDVEYYKKGNRSILKKWNQTMTDFRNAFMRRDDSRLIKLNTKLKNMRDELVETAKRITESMNEVKYEKHNGVRLIDYMQNFGTKISKHSTTLDFEDIV
tara:strand:- start:60 stop:365 length:306 start_codon:yes stop_codon:yes gene_type:complete